MHRNRRKRPSEARSSYGTGNSDIVILSLRGPAEMWIPSAGPVSRPAAGSFVDGPGAREGPSRPKA
eukprot:4130394-Pyramimonas_sp.AAC.1